MHNPEQGVVNQEKLLNTLSQGLCSIADVLPRLEQTVRLFPTEDIRRAVIVMYAYVLRFLIRSLRWYQESKRSHLIHSITRPTELRYDDLVQKICYLSRNIADLASASSQAEIRGLHLEQREFVSKQLGFNSGQGEFISEQLSFNAELREQLSGMQVELRRNLADTCTMRMELRESLVSQQSINASAQVTIRHELSESQLSKFMDFLANTIKNPLGNPKTSFETSVILRNRRRLRESIVGPPFWLTPKVQSWNQTPESRIVLLKGTRKSRFHIKDFLTDSISQLLDSNIPAIWALKAGPEHQDNIPQSSTTDLLKYIISQAINLNPAMHNEASLANHLHIYSDADKEEAYFQLLGSIIQNLPFLYILIDTELISSNSDFSFPKHFLKLFSDMKSRGITTVIKVIFVSYGSPLFETLTSGEFRNLVVPIKNISKRASRRMVMRGRGRKGGRGGTKGGSMLLHG